MRTSKITAKFQEIFLICIGLYFICVWVGCNGCGFMKNNSDLDHKENSNSANDIPKINKNSNSVPNAEIIFGRDSIGYEMAYLFDEKSNFLGRITQDNFEADNKDREKFFQQFETDHIDHQNVIINENNSKKIFSKLRDMGFEITEQVFAKVKKVNGKGLIALDVLDNNINGKVKGYLTKAQIDFYDKNECLIGPFVIVSLYNYKGQLIKILTQKDVGSDFIVSNDYKTLFTNFIKCECGHDEPNCYLKYHRFKNIVTGYTFDFNLSKFEKISDYEEPAIYPEEIILKDSLIQMIYNNRPNVLRIVIEPYSKKIFYKEYNFNLDFDGAYSQKYKHLFDTLKLPNGETEQYKNYKQIQLR